MSNDSSNNGWHEWSRHVLSELERHNGLLESIREGQSKIQIDIAMLKVKAITWGSLGGSIPVVVAIAIWLIERSGG